MLLLTEFLFLTWVARDELQLETKNVSKPWTKYGKGETRFSNIRFYVIGTKPFFNNIIKVVGSLKKSKAFKNLSTWAMVLLYTNCDLLSLRISLDFCIILLVIIGRTFVFTHKQHTYEDVVHYQI